MEPRLGAAGDAIGLDSVPVPQATLIIKKMWPHMATAARPPNRSIIQQYEMVYGHNIHTALDICMTAGGDRPVRV